MKKIIFCFLSILSFNLWAQDGDLNMKIIAHVPAPEGGSGIWHYVDRNGIEYAVFGSRTAVVIYSLEDPTKPIERYRLTGVTTTWREVYIYGDYIYGVNDQTANGLIIINMKGAPNNITGKFWSASITANGTTADLNTCHTVFVDEKGRLYLNGCSPWRGTLIFDVSKTPEEPKYLGAQTKRYCHDNFGRNDTIWSSDIFDGVLSMWDIKDPANPKELGFVTTPFAFTHNAWPSDDGKYAFATDERENAYVASYDMTDLSDIKLLDKWRPKDTENMGVIPHNTRYINGFLVTAFYTDGVKINDVHRPDNIIEVGSVDTWFGPSGGFNGCWGVSPYLPSGTIVASDIQGGLFVIKADYIRACYLEGNVKDSLTKIDIKDVSVIIKASRKNEKNTDARGNYKTGYAIAGTYDVSYSHPDYFPKTVTVELKNGELTMQDVLLKPKNTLINQKILVLDAVTNDPIPNAHVLLTNVSRNVSALTDINGEVSLNFFQDIVPFDLYAGKWSYYHSKLSYDSENPPALVTIYLNRGYQDDFIFDQGWNVKGNATTGQWERGIPVQTTQRNVIVNPGIDIDSDYGKECYVTGNKGGAAADDDVDNGNTILTSPTMNLSNYRRPLMRYHSWFVNTGGNDVPNDKFTVRISNGKSTVLLTEHLTTQNGWIKADSIDLKNLLELTDSMYVFVEAADLPAGHLVEGGFDGFYVWESTPSGTFQAKNEFDLRLIPSHFKNSTRLEYSITLNVGSSQLVISNLQGIVVENINLTEYKSGSLQIGESLAPGIYFAQIVSAVGKSSLVKFVKL